MACAVAASLDALHASRSGPLGAVIGTANALNNDPGFRAATMPITAPVGDFIGRTVEGVAPFVAIGDPENGLLAGLARLGEGEAAHLATASLAHDAERAPLADARAGCYCFPAGTGVVTPHGQRAIDTLHVGDTVLAEDPHTHKLDAEPVQAVIADGVKPLMAVDLSDGSAITVTTNHPFYVDSGTALAGRGWLPAGSLRVGDHLRTAAGHDVTVIGLHQGVGHAPVYTLTVAHDHTFFVGSAQVLVHNATGPGRCGSQGGRYGQATYNNRLAETAHHTPAMSAYPEDVADPIKASEAPSVRMLHADHKLTGSYIRYKSSDVYRAKQAELINQGRFLDALGMDVTNLRSNPQIGDTYNEGIMQMLEYTRTIDL